MANGRGFVRRPYEPNPDIVTCHCAKCGALVGASINYRILKGMEDAHNCVESSKQADAEQAHPLIRIAPAQGMVEQSRVAQHPANGDSLSDVVPPQPVITKYLDGMPVAWRCSECGETVDVDGSLYTTPSQLKTFFDKHCRDEHSAHGKF